MDHNTLARVKVIQQMLTATQGLLDDLIADSADDRYDTDDDRVNVS